MTKVIQVICVEDEPMIRELLPKALELAGIKVTMIYRTGEELLSQRVERRIRA